MSVEPGSLMLYLPVPRYETPQGIYFDTQTCNGLREQLTHFSRIDLVTIVVQTNKPPVGTSLLSAEISDPRLEMTTLPHPRNLLDFVRLLPKGAAILRTVMRRSDHLLFPIGNTIGDWGAVAVLMAHRQGLEAAVWTDRVESRVLAFALRKRRGLARLYHGGIAFLSRFGERFVIARAVTGMFHGKETYDAYARYSPDPHLVHDIQVGAEARITDEALAAKRARPARRPLTVVYAGRAHAEKGIVDWIDTLDRAHRAGIPFTATWYGDGPMLDTARALISERGLDASIRFPGHVSDKAALLASMKDADIFLFCHKTPESPRCLIEALLAGTPIVGYDSSYPRDLIKTHGGGLLVEPSPLPLASALIQLYGDRGKLGALMDASARDGHPMIASHIYGERSELIKRYSNGAAPPAITTPPSPRRP